MSPPEQSGREKEIFEQALDLPSAEARLGYAQGACGGDAGLLARVRALLQAHDEPGGFLPGKPGAASDSTVNHAMAESPEKPGTIIGRYKLLERIGEGGFGSVYMAEQSEPVRRRVALKVIKLGMDTKEVVARFEAERQALAMMDHPNIAKVFDAGATDTGRPYFVMELVKGVPITTYCDQRRLSTPARLELFILVCQAVQHAHQKGIIHRDLKPSNILVTEQDGRAVPKVIDFGVARATQARLTEKTMFTQFHQMVGTPAYMSPEQTGLANLDIDTRSDIYSLGVLLYELLTGCTPFDAKKLLEAGYDGIMRIIREVEPPKPSTRLSSLTVQELSELGGRRQEEPRRLGRLIQGDLDWIVMKALEKDRARRYETATSFAQDLRRHLDNEPVVARPTSNFYRFKKMVRRNRLAFGAVVTFVALWGVGSGISTYMAVRAVLAEKEAEASAAGINRIRNLMDIIFDQISEAGSVYHGFTPEQDITLRQALDRAAQYLRGNDGLLFSRGLKNRGEIGRFVGDTYLKLGDYPKAVDFLEKAVALNRGEFGNSHDRTLGCMESLARAYQQVGRHTDALALFEEIYRVRLVQSGLGNQFTLHNLSDLGFAYIAAGQEAKGVAQVESALNGYRHTYGDNDASVLEATDILADAQWRAGHLAEAVVLYEKTLARAKTHFAYGPRAYFTMNVMDHLARAYRAAGRATAAVELGEEALKLRKSNHLLGLNTTNPQTLFTMGDLALAYRDASRVPDAITLGAETLALSRKIFGDTGFTTLRLLHHQATFLEETREFAQAEALSRELLAADLRKEAADSAIVAEAQTTLGEILLDQQKFAEAEPLLRESLITREKKSPEPWITFHTRSALGQALAGQKKFTEAEPLLLSGYEGLKRREEKIVGADRAVLKDALIRLVQLYTDWGQPGKSADWQQKLDQWHQAEVERITSLNPPAK